MEQEKDFIDGECQKCEGKLYVNGTVEKESEDEAQKFKVKCDDCGNERETYLTVEEK